MTNPAIIEAATQAMPSFWTENDKKWLVRDILAAVTPLIEAAALERAARVADDHELADGAYIAATSRQQGAAMTDDIIEAAVQQLRALTNERKEIAEQARRYAGHYKEGSDGRNTFVMLAEWIEARK